MNAEQVGEAVPVRKRSRLRRLSRGVQQYAIRITTSLIERLDTRLDHLSTDDQGYHQPSIIHATDLLRVPDGQALFEKTVLAMDNYKHLGTFPYICIYYAMPGRRFHVFHSEDEPRAAHFYEQRHILNQAKDAEILLLFLPATEVEETQVLSPSFRNNLVATEPQLRKCVIVSLSLAQVNYLKSTGKLPRGMVRVLVQGPRAFIENAKQSKSSITASSPPIIADRSWIAIFRSWVRWIVFLLLSRIRRILYRLLTLLPITRAGSMLSYVSLYYSEVHTHKSARRRLRSVSSPRQAPRKDSESKTVRFAVEESQAPKPQPSASRNKNVRFSDSEASGSDVSDVESEHDQTLTTVAMMSDI